jgi:hypothetical protein
MRGSLHCAVYDEALNSFGRDDEVFCSFEREQATTTAGPSTSLRMTKLFIDSFVL